MNGILKFIPNAISLFFRVALWFCVHNSAFRIMNSELKISVVELEIICTNIADFLAMQDFYPAFFFAENADFGTIGEQAEFIRICRWAFANIER